MCKTYKLRALAHQERAWIPQAICKNVSCTLYMKTSEFKTAEKLPTTATIMIIKKHNKNCQLIPFNEFTFTHFKH